MLLAGGTLGALRKQVSQPKFIKFNKWGIELHLLLLACFVVLVVEILCGQVMQEVSFPIQTSSSFTELNINKGKNNV